MSKVILPKEIAEEVENMRESGKDNGTIVVTTHYSGTSTLLGRWYFNGNKDNLLSALVNGYEVEQTPEDRLREYYEKVEIESFRANTKKQWHHEAELMGRLVGVRTALRILGITIEGIND